MLSPALPFANDNHAPLSAVESFQLALAHLQVTAAKNRGRVDIAGESYVRVGEGRRVQGDGPRARDARCTVAHG